MITTIIIYLLGVVATAILLIFIVVKEDDEIEITLLSLFLGITISLTSWFGFVFASLIKYGEVVIYKRKK